MRLRPAFPVVLLLVAFAIGLFALHRRPSSSEDTADTTTLPLPPTKKRNFTGRGCNTRPARALWRVWLWIWIRQLVARLPQGRSPVSSGHEAPYPHSGSFARTGRRSGSHRRRLQRHRQLSLGVRRAGSNLDLHRGRSQTLRDYLLKGGFLMVDDFHGTEDWEAVPGRHAHGLSRSAHRGPRQQGRNFSHALRSRRSLPGARRAIREHRQHL